MNELQSHVQREVLRYEVGRRISCPITGEVLDVRTAVMVENTAGLTLGVVSAKAWEEISEGVLKTDPTVVVTKGADL